MSYDLFFRSRSPGQSFSQEDFIRYFSGRRLCEVKGAQTWYSNEDSGVYFSFDYTEEREKSDGEELTDSSLLPLSFSLNYFRPHCFGLEAELEVASFVAEFDLTVSDSQLSGMGDGEYSKDGFLRGWNAGNAFGYRAIVSQDPTQSFLTLPSSRIEASWRWNFSRESRQSEIGDKAFVPRIFFFDVDGEVRTGVAWKDCISILLPVVDIVFVPRQRLAPRRWFRSSDDLIVFAWAEMEPIVRRFQKAAAESESYELFYETTPPDIERVICQKQSPKKMPKAVAFDHVLDRELLEQARRQQPTSG